MSRYYWVDSRKVEGFEVRAACNALGVSASAYYEWVARMALGPSEAEWDEALLVNEIYDVHRHLDDTYGSPRMTAELRSRGFCVNHKRTERLMAAYGIYARDGRRKKVRTTIPDLSAPPLPDLVHRDFTPGAPARRTCGDITYIATTEGWLYLASVEDIGSRRLIGYAMADHMRTELVASALTMAADTRGGHVAGMTFHHDRGSQYMSREFRRLCATLGVLQLVSRTGSCLDNAVAESFWATLKRELVSRLRFATRDDAKRAITAWIRHYNALRLHSSLGHVSPITWELRFSQSVQQAA